MKSKTIDPLTHNLPPVVPASWEIEHAARLAEKDQLTGETTSEAVKAGRAHIADGAVYENATIEQLMFAVVRYKQRMKAATHFALIGERTQALIRIEGATAEFKAFCYRWRLPIYFGDENAT